MRNPIDSSEDSVGKHKGDANPEPIATRYEE
jgi:hypothetical protein